MMVVMAGRVQLLWLCSLSHAVPDAARLSITGVVDRWYPLEDMWSDRKVSTRISSTDGSASPAGSLAPHPATRGRMTKTIARRTAEGASR